MSSVESSGPDKKTITESRLYSQEELNQLIAERQQVATNVDNIRIGVENGIMAEMPMKGRGLGNSPIESGVRYKVSRSGYSPFEVVMDITPWTEPSEKTKVNKMVIQRHIKNYISKPKAEDILGVTDNIEIDNLGNFSYSKTEQVATGEQDKYEERVSETGELRGFGPLNDIVQIEHPEKALEIINSCAQIAMLRPKVEKVT